MAPPPQRRRSQRLAEADARLHADALRETKAFFCRLGDELQAAEDEAAREAFAARVATEEERTGRVCVLLAPVEDDDNDDVDESEGEEDEEEDDEGSDGDEASAADEDFDPERLGLMGKLNDVPRVFVPEEAAQAAEATIEKLEKLEGLVGRDGDVVLRVVKDVLSRPKGLPSLLAATAALGAYSDWKGCRAAAAVIRDLVAGWSSVLGARDSDLGIDAECRDALIRRLEELSAPFPGAGGFDAHAFASPPPPRKRARET